MADLFDSFLTSLLRNQREADTDYDDRHPDTGKVLRCEVVDVHSELIAQQFATMQQDEDSDELLVSNELVEIRASVLVSRVVGVVRAPPPPSAPLSSSEDCSTPSSLANTSGEDEDEDHEINEWIRSPSPQIVHDFTNLPVIKVKSLHGSDEEEGDDGEPPHAEPICRSDTFDITTEDPKGGGDTRDATTMTSAQLDVAAAGDDVAATQPCLPSTSEVTRKSRPTSSTKRMACNKVAPYTAFNDLRNRLTPSPTQNATSSNGSRHRRRKLKRVFKMLASIFISPYLPRRMMPF